MRWKVGGRRRWAALWSILTVLALGVGVLPSTAAWVRQDEPTGVVVAGDRAGEVAFELVGRVERRETSVTAYGFFSFVAGVADTDLFTDPANPSAATARLTFFATADPLPGLALDGVAVAAALGELSVYANPRAGATFDTGESFFSGTRVAVAQVRLHDILIGDPSATRTVDLFAGLLVTESTPFALESGAEVQFSQVDTVVHWTGGGSEEPPAEDANRAVTTFAARAVVASSPGSVPPVATEEPAETEEPDATAEPTDEGNDEEPTEEGDDEEPTEEPDGEETPVAADVDCDEVEEWLIGTLGRVGRARGLVTTPLQVLDDEEADPFEELDPDNLREAADEFNDLADAQQEVEAPADLEDTGRLILASFQSFARALNLLATAVDNQNETALEQAQTLLDGADQALSEGSRPLSDIARSCDFRP